MRPLVNEICCKFIVNTSCHLSVMVLSSTPWLNELLTTSPEARTHFSGDSLYFRPRFTDAWQQLIACGVKLKFHGTDTDTDFRDAPIV